MADLALFDVDEPTAPEVDQPSLFDDPEPTSPVETCSCLRTRGEGEGFTNAAVDGAEWWVHVGCRRPTAQYAAAMGHAQ